MNQKKNETGYTRFQLVIIKCPLQHLLTDMTNSVSMCMFTTDEFSFNKSEHYC